MGVTSGRGYQEAGVASGWNLSMSVVRMYRCGYTFPYSTCISSFFGSSIPISLFI